MKISLFKLKKREQNDVRAFSVYEILFWLEFWTLWNENLVNILCMDERFATTKSKYKILLLFI